MSGYDGRTLDEQVAILDAERAHIGSLHEATRMWEAAVGIIDDTRTNLHNFTVNLRHNAWFDQAGEEFGSRVGESVNLLNAWHDSSKANLEVLRNLVQEVRFTFPVVYRNVCTIRADFQRDKLANPDVRPDDYQRRAGEELERIDQYYNAIAWGFIHLSQNEDWTGPRAQVPGNGDAPSGSPSGSPAADDPSGAGTPDPATVPGPQSAEVPDSAAAPQQAAKPLSDAASALQAAQELLNGMQVPDPVTVPGLDVPPMRYAEAAYEGPALAGAGAGTSVGGVAGGAGAGAGPTNLTVPGTASPTGAGTPPAAAGSTAAARGLAGAAAAGSPPPMYPPNSGAGAARSAPGGIKPGNSDRPADRPRPRRSPPVTPGVALTGRAGAAAPAPAARRGWDSDNDSLQVLDEQLWQVNPQEEETHGQDRRGPGRDGRDRAAAHRAPDAGLVGPGGRADQPTRAR